VPTGYYPGKQLYDKPKAAQNIWEYRKGQQESSLVEDKLIKKEYSVQF